MINMHQVVHASFVIPQVSGIEFAHSIRVSSAGTLFKSVWYGVIYCPSFPSSIVNVAALFLPTSSATVSCSKYLVHLSSPCSHFLFPSFFLYLLFTLLRSPLLISLLLFSSRLLHLLPVINFCFLYVSLTFDIIMVYFGMICLYITLFPPIFPLKDFSRRFDHFIGKVWCPRI